ncbi:MAG: carbon-nitrogen hydrolase family protein [Deferrisomatales bacterium]|nr:carbon-nitrogen hydrolase family protein [Deferrisomatales bacterium]
MFLAAVIQLNSGTDPEANCAAAEALVRRAAGYGARLVATPENTNFLGPDSEKVGRAETLEGPTCARFAAVAVECGIHLLLGSFNERSPDPARCFNTSVLFGPDGRRLAVYRKLHLFDVDLGDGQAFAESSTVWAGDDAVTVATAWGHLGLSICYDLRFPELYRMLVDAGAEVLCAPAAFTLTTGRDHWEPLLRARAVENQCYLLAPAQWGRHDDQGLRESYGHAAIIDPWGQVIAAASDGLGLALAEIDLGRVAAARARVPSLAHRRFRVVPGGP